MKIDIASTLATTSRVVELREHEGAPAQVVVASRVYDTSIDDLWDALTSPERIPRWFLPVSGDLELGGRFQLEGNAGGEITACDPPRRLAVTWEIGGDTSWVQVGLSEVDGGTRLDLEHIARPSKHWETFGPGATGVGWELGLVGLARHLESGEAVDRGEAMAWSMSPDGLAFMRQSSERWGQASIEAGTAPEAARAAAERTTAFYTGG